MGRRQPESGSSARRLTSKEREIRALQLRIEGRTLQEIAEAIGYAHASGARKALERGIDKLDKLSALEAAQYVRIELERLDRMTVGLWSDATSGDSRAVYAVLAVMERRAKLLGLDAATRIAGADGGALLLAGPDGGEIRVRAMYESLSDEEIASRLEDLRGYFEEIGS